MADIRDPWRWRPLTGVPPDAHEWLAPEYEALVAEWVDLRERLAKDTLAAEFVGDRLTKRQREFAVETGAIERLYHLRRGVTQHLVAEGLNIAVAAHTLEGVQTETLRGLLADQEAALEVVYRDTAADAEISPVMLKRWHALLVRNQETVTGMTRDVLGQVPFTEKGVWKTRPNNPSIPGSGVFEYCPPDRVADEVDRLCTLYSRIRRERFPVHAEAAWLHHRFARTHPFQDGNGRVSRLLMASCYSRRGLVPPPASGGGPRGLLRRPATRRCRRSQELCAVHRVAGVGRPARGEHRGTERPCRPDGGSATQRCADGRGDISRTAVAGP